uniref:Uncharacterized protein n=1 Tax=Oryza barthii TaxID=65489 RepID=A0A0D3F6Z4_9ORYZ
MTGSGDNRAILSLCYPSPFHTTGAGDEVADREGMRGGIKMQSSQATPSIMVSSILRVQGRLETGLSVKTSLER